MTPEWEAILEQKEKRRRILAALPIEEKIRILVRLQEMAAPVQRLKGRPSRIWPAPPAPPAPAPAPGAR